MENNEGTDSITDLFTVYRPSFSTVFSAAGVYAVFVSALYLYGYWAGFGLNILEYIGIGDLLGYGIFPFFALAVSVLLGQVVGGLLTTGFLRLFPPRSGIDDTAFGRSLSRFALVLLALFVILIFIFAWFGREPVKWLVVAALIGWLSFPIAAGTDYMAWISDPIIRALVLYFLFTIPGYEFFKGRSAAYDVRHGHGPLCVDLRRSGLQLSSDQNHPVTYMGHLGDFFILYESVSGGVIIVRTDKVGTLALIPKTAGGPKVSGSGN